MLRLLPALALLLAALPVQAGVWDRDRPTDKTLPTVSDVITGRYDRFSAAYYRARLRRLEPELVKLRAINLDAKPQDLQLHLIVDGLPIIDDAAVARMRLGEFGDAIILLDWKSRLTDSIRGVRTATAKLHAYRAAANKVACLRLRWLTAQRPDPADLTLARDLLEAALKDDAYNADARWTLTEIKWLIRGARFEPDGDPVFANMLGLTDSSFAGDRNEAALARNNVSGCIQYLCRRIVYEGGPDVDLMYALSLALTLSGRNDEAAVAWLRLSELIDEGLTSRAAGSPASNALKQLMGVHLGKPDGLNALRNSFRESREQAKQWHESRANYLKTQLDAGNHPDTKANFWADWSMGAAAPSAPTPEANSDPLLGTTLLVGGVALMLLLIIGFSVFLAKRTAPPPSIDEL